MDNQDISRALLNHVAVEQDKNSKHTLITLIRETSLITRNNGRKFIVKHFNTSGAQHFFLIKITTTWNALPYEVVVSSRTVNSFKNSLDKHWAENPANV